MVPDQLEPTSVKDLVLYDPGCQVCGPFFLT